LGSVNFTLTPIFSNFLQFFQFFVTPIFRKPDGGVPVKVCNASGQTIAPALSAYTPSMAKREGHHDSNSGARTHVSCTAMKQACQQNCTVYRMKRKTVSKRLIAKVVAYKEWLKANRTLPTAEIMKTTVAKLRGHFAYYGVTDNSKSLQSFAYWVTQTLYKWLNRRGKRGCYTWEKFNKLLKLYPLPNPRIKVNLLSASR
jgi:hypothetical protein